MEGWGEVEGGLEACNLSSTGSLSHIQPSRRCSCPEGHTRWIQSHTAQGKGWSEARPLR